jgi:hypothetical protein
MSFIFYRSSHYLPVQRMALGRLNRYDHGFIHFIADYAPYPCLLIFFHYYSLTGFPPIPPGCLSYLQFPFTHHCFHPGNILLYPPDFVMVYQLPGGNPETKVK